MNCQCLQLILCRYFVKRKSNLFLERFTLVSIAFARLYNYFLDFFRINQKRLQMFWKRVCKHSESVGAICFQLEKIQNIVGLSLLGTGELRLGNPSRGIARNCVARRQAHMPRSETRFRPHKGKCRPKKRNWGR